MNAPTAPLPSMTSTAATAFVSAVPLRFDRIRSSSSTCNIVRFPLPVRHGALPVGKRRCGRDGGSDRARIVPMSALEGMDWNRVQARATDAARTTRQFFQTSTGQAVLWGGLLWLLLTGRAGWLFDSVIFLLFFVSVVPIFGIFVLKWWLNRQVVQGSCPNCGADVAGLRGRPFQCHNCGQVINGEVAQRGQRGKATNFAVNDPATATIDIDAKRVD